jgi:hypothetical protein
MKLTVASFENKLNANFFNSISISIIDENKTEIPIETTINNPIEIIIPHPSNIIIPPMILQDVISIPHNKIFHFHAVNITTTLPISIHIEIHPLNMDLSYLLIYKFDQMPQLNNSIKQLDGWTTFCPSNLSSGGIYTYFIGNQRTEGHKSIIFGLRELSSSEMINYCLNNFSLNDLPIINEQSYFTSNYELRVYKSGCYYLDQNNQWKSDGLLVS